jgi:Dihaem cytochrome c
MKTKNRLMMLALVSVSGIGGTGSAAADERVAYTLAPTYKEECGSCHVAYPPALLSAASWRAVMAGLGQHFGSDASLDPAKGKDIGAYLQANAGTGAKTAALDDKGRPLLRISDSAWFRREHRDGHDGITTAVWTLPAVKSVANCGACHRGAEQGVYSEDAIRIPRP